MKHKWVLFEVSVLDMFVTPILPHMFKTLLIRWLVRFCFGDSGTEPTPFSLISLRNCYIF